jgi:branched-chain amino acid transport system ATP-binding protein
MAVLLQTEQLTRRFGGIAALKDVSLAIEEGSISAIIGPNGAGKTILFNLCSGVDRPTSGRALFAGEPIGGAGSPAPSRT